MFRRTVGDGCFLSCSKEPFQNFNLLTLSRSIVFLIARIIYFPSSLSRSIYFYKSIFSTNKYLAQPVSTSNSNSHHFLSYLTRLPQNAFAKRIHSIDRNPFGLGPYPDIFKLGKGGGLQK